MKYKLTILISLFVQLCYSQTDCKLAVKAAKHDFNKGQYTLHSLEFQPVHNTYVHVLRKNHGIQWRFVGNDSLSYYDCYDSVMISHLKNKYGIDFLNRANKLADSLQLSPNWIAEPEYPGGSSKFYEFIFERLKYKPANLKDNQAKAYVKFIITDKGEITDVELVRGGINEDIDRQLIEIFYQMPKWTPEYLYGEPIGRRMVLAIDLKKNK